MEDYKDKKEKILLSLRKVEREIASIKKARLEQDAKGNFKFPKAYKAYELRKLVYERSSLQANLARI